MRERKIETMLVKQVKAAGGMALKLISPGMAGVPDRIVLLPGGRILFVELKAPGEKPRPLQRKPLLVFYTFKHDAQRIAKHLTAAGYPVSVLKGDQDIQRWNRGEIPVLLVHPASAGHGLNLQAGGHTVVWFGLPWSLELYEQGNGRIHRQGQEKPVVVYHLASIGTIDEVVMVALEGKASRQAALLAAVIKNGLNLRICQHQILLCKCRIGVPPCPAPGGITHMKPSEMIVGELIKLNDSFTGIKDKTADMRADISKLHSSLKDSGGIVEKVSNMQTDIRNLDIALQGDTSSPITVTNSINTKVSYMQGKITDLKTTFQGDTASPSTITNSIKGKVSSMRDDITSLNTTLQGDSSRPTTIADSVKNQVSKMRDSIDGLGDDLNDLKDYVGKAINNIPSVE